MLRKVYTDFLESMISSITVRSADNKIVDLAHVHLSLEVLGFQ